MRFLPTGVAVLLLTAAFSSCCKPRVTRFDATPPILCGQATVLRWEASGDVVMHLETEPTPPPSETCAAGGRETLALTLVATRHGEEDQRPIEVVQLHPAASEPIAFATKTLAGNDVLAGGEKNLKLWVRNEANAAPLANEVVVTSVVACGGRGIEVAHDGKTASLSADGTPSNDLAGTPVGGNWELRSPLTPGELANPRSRPKELKILASIECRKGSR
jgi:hypothetical protein